MTMPLPATIAPTVCRQPPSRLAARASRAGGSSNAAARASACRRRRSAGALLPAACPEKARTAPDDFDDVADFVDQQTDHSVLATHHYVHGQNIGRTRFGRPRRRRRSMAVTICPRRLMRPAEYGRGQRHRGHGVMAQDLLYLRHLDSEQQVRAGENVQNCLCVEHPSRPPCGDRRFETAAT